MQHVIDQSALQALWYCFVLSLAAASIAYTITQTELFLPVRKIASKVGHMTGYLFHCFYCMSHWIVFAGVLIYQPVLISSGHLYIDLITSAVCAVTLTTFIKGIMFGGCRNAMAKMMKEKELKVMMEKENAK